MSNLWVPEFDIIKSSRDVLYVPSKEQTIWAIATSYTNRTVNNSLTVVNHVANRARVNFGLNLDLEVLKVLEAGEIKYGPHTWLQPNGPTSDEKSMHKSMFTHWSEAETGLTEDEESGLHPYAHLTCRALMVYTLRKRANQQYWDDSPQAVS